MLGAKGEVMEQVSGADLLAIRSQAAMADDYTTICRNNIDRLTQAYLELQVENVRLQKLAKDAHDAWDNDHDAKVGKLLYAMLSPEFCKCYRPDLTPNAIVRGEPQGESRST